MPTPILVIFVTGLRGVGVGVGGSGVGVMVGVSIGRGSSVAVGLAVDVAVASGGEGSAFSCHWPDRNPRANPKRRTAARINSLRSHCIL